MLYGAIEAGGTKMNCAVADEETIIDECSLPTTTPEETLAAIFAFFDQYTLASLGVGSFGPIGINPQQETYGKILATPKKGWQQFDFLGTLKKRYPDTCLAWTTDVNAAAFGELKQGAAQGMRSCVYLTIGTGIGAGIVSNEEIFQGAGHPEVGHTFVKRHPQDDYAGTCPYHGDCLEGLAAGPSLEARTGIKGQDLPKEHEIWDLQAFYIGQALVNITLTVAPDRIILGGGVMNQPHLLKKIQEQFIEQMAGYMETPPASEYIVAWGLPNKSGIIGSLLLGKAAYQENQ
ncbi:ROK family protein [Enterococcus sp.]|uniref:ROK family protein n=1 Tax=Enterococcus sp. TaxID=35783 RepID=UPI0025C000DB|nr:ROK family protein [Enterococcus sp.]